MNDSKIETTWAGVVHSRTYDADFCLAVPDGTSETERKWLQEVCSASSRSAGDESKGVFVACRSDTLTLAGILVESTFCSDDKQYHRDKFGRSFNVFLGFVTRDSISQLPPMDIETFRPLYRFVISRWNVDPYATCESTLIESSYADIQPDSDSCGDTNLNLDLVIQRIFPFTDKEEIWRQFCIAASPCSLIVGAKSRKADRFFINAVCSDCGRREDRFPKVDESIGKKPGPISDGSKESEKLPKTQTKDNNELGTRDIIPEIGKSFVKMAGKFLGFHCEGSDVISSSANNSQLNELDSIIQDFKASGLSQAGRECLIRLVSFRDNLRRR